ncbi:hypothetical protein [Methylobacterium haplocladii]|uniref:Uncharacterized protein n=1 Tax=Methylobacterium haplocladii TaxID=1176176 RepID=A0A512IM56_9HYPH|nr:hypothetical protein [Methylobacterium haplocladii]GEO98796.1 hypothetical protein MHA02_11840 [Methylobacterium haplocladii]GJD84731.1 hypothetical protein HPGCJGGD_2613 [Methylobacterium haplocladii]GLS60236.1 hypothetical protein GCM10007887_29140 [Methylobacterium haplocladii]
MPNFDGGHYFLTVLAPVRTDVLVADDGQTCSPVSALHRALYVLPTALQSPATTKIGINSPFSRNTRTHFARFAILTDVVFNGRTERNALEVALRGPNPAVAEPVDKLPCPYLVFVADFDARSGDESELRAYLDELWRTMGKELKSIFSACYGFEGIDDSRGFQDYVLRCQIETTMPFNDYWVGAPQVPSLRQNWLIGPAAVSAVVFLGALVLAILHVGGLPWLAIATIGFVALVASLFVAYLTVMRNGAVPFPTAPHSDLPSVLKALYLQQAFTRFALANQGVDAATLHAAFGRFIDEHRPDDPSGPTQAAGVVTTLGPTPVAPYNTQTAAPPAGALRSGRS